MPFLKAKSGQKALFLVLFDRYVKDIGEGYNRHVSTINETVI